VQVCPPAQVRVPLKVAVVSVDGGVQKQQQQQQKSFKK
jgi:hypothetical protein